MWKQPLQLAAKLYRQSFLPIVFAVLPVALIECFSLVYLNDKVFGYDPESFASLRTDGLVHTVFTPLWALPVLYTVRQQYHGEVLIVREVASFVCRNYFPLLGALIVVNFLVTLGLIALIVPGVYLAGKYFLIAPVVAFDRDLLVSTRVRSGQLMEGRKTSSLVIAILIFVAWAGLFFLVLFGLYLVFPEASWWMETLIESVFAVPFAFLTVFAYAVYADATGDEGEGEESPAV